MLAELATQIACVYVYVDDCLKASLCLLAVHKYICISIQACTACYSWTGQRFQLIFSWAGPQGALLSDIEAEMDEIVFSKYIDFLVLCLYRRLIHLFSPKH